MTSPRPPETSSATGSVDSKLAASASSPSGVITTRPAERTTRSSQIAISQNRDASPRRIARPTHLLHLRHDQSPPTVVSE